MGEKLDRMKIKKRRQNRSSDTTSTRQDCQVDFDFLRCQIGPI